MQKYKQIIEDNIEYIPESGCHIWLGYCNPDGYGQRKINGKTLRIHRLSYEVYKEEIPHRMCVCHKCDNPSCVNPEHLFLGTHSDNMKDMWDKGRHKKPTSKGGAELSLKEVDEIRGMKGKISGLKLSKLYNVNSQSIRNIWDGTTWKQ